MKKAIFTIKKYNRRKQAVGCGRRRLALLMTVLFAACFWMAGKIQAQPCRSPDLITVRGTAGPNNYYSGSPSSLLDLIGFRVTPNGSVEFAFSYQKKNPDWTIAPGISGYLTPASFSIKSYNRGGNLIDTIDFPSTEILVRISDHDTADTPVADAYSLIVGEQAGNYDFYPQLVLSNQANLNIKPGEPSIFLNSLNFWEKKDFTLSFPINDEFEFGLNNPLTSLSATVTTGQQIHCPGIRGLVNLVNSLPSAAFRSAGNRNALLSRLDAVEQKIRDGKTDAAIEELRNVRRRADGCGSFAGNDDWIVDCAAQTELRSLIDQLIESLGG